jgi:hypothetical protein
LRIIARLSVAIETDFINACLLQGARLGMPGVSAALDMVEFLHSQATPNTPTF